MEVSKSAGCAAAPGEVILPAATPLLFCCSFSSSVSLSLSSLSLLGLSPASLVGKELRALGAPTAASVVIAFSSSVASLSMSSSPTASWAGTDACGLGVSPPATLVGTDRAATAASVGIDSSSVLFVVNTLAVSFFSSSSGADPAVVAESSSSSWPPPPSPEPSFSLLFGRFPASVSSLTVASAAAAVPLFCDDRPGDGDASLGLNGCVSRSNFSGESSANPCKAGFGWVGWS